MISEQTKLSNKKAQPTMDKFSNLSQAAQVAVFNFKHAKTGKSYIPNVPVNYTCSKKQKAGKSFIPRFTLIHSKQTKNVKNEKPSLSAVNYFNLKNLKKDKLSEPVKKNRKSYIPRRVTKKVAPLPNKVQEKSQQKTVEPKRVKPTSLFGKSKIPVLTSTTSTTSTSTTPITSTTSTISTKRIIPNRTIHSRTCSRCSSKAPVKKENARGLRFKPIKNDKDDQALVSRSNTIKDNKDNQARVSRFNTIKDNKVNQARVSHFNAIQDDQTHLPPFNAIQDDQVRVLTSVKSIDAQIHVLTYDIIKNDDILSHASVPQSLIPQNDDTSSHASVPQSLIPDIIKKDTSASRSIIPIRNLTQNLFKKRVAPLQPSSTLVSVEQEKVAHISAFTSNKKANNLSFISLKHKHTQLQKSVNMSEASISIVEISTTTLMIKPELSSISLLYEAEKNLSSKRQVHQIEDYSDDDSSLFGNVVKKIVRFSKDLFSKMI